MSEKRKSKGKVNPWAAKAFKRAEQRRRTVRGIPAVVEVEPGRAEEVASSLRRIGYKVEGIVGDFVFVDLPDPADFDKVSTLAYVRVVSVQKKIYPMALGIDELFKRVAIATDPLLSKLETSDLEELGVKVKPAAEIPTPFQALTSMVSESLKFAVNPLGRITDYLRGFPPVVARADWRLVTDTRKLMEAPEENELSRETKVGVIDTGVNSPPPLPLNKSLGIPFLNYECISLAAEPPFDFMGHGSWCTSCAFGKTAFSRYGLFVPVSSAAWYLHVKVFSAFGPCSSFQIMKAMELCAEKGCKVVSMSLGGPLEGSVEEDPECVLAKKLYEKYGTNFVVAAGNDGEEWSINSPGASPYVLCVAALDWKTMETASYSSRGPQARWYRDHKEAYDGDHRKYGEDFLKPDVSGIGGDGNSQIVAACTPWYDGLYDFFPDSFDMMIGTSMATPHVAGLVALGIDKGLIRNVDDVKVAMKKASPVKTVEKGYGLLRWSVLGG